MKSFLFGVLISVTGFFIRVFPQSSGNFLEIEGVVELNMTPLKNATVTLYQKNSKINSITTGSDGIFRFKLDMNNYYIVEVSKNKYISKRIAFDTSIPDDQATWTKTWGFAISVLKSCEGVNYSALKEPVDIIKYNKRRKDFDSDKDYVFMMKTKIENIEIAYERCAENKYRELIEEADRLFNNRTYEQSRDKYYAALDVYPDESYPKKKIEEINNLLNRQENIGNIYDKTIEEADVLFAQNKYNDALLKYKGALTLKPQEKYPREKVNEIESLLAKSQAEQQATNAMESRYNSLVTRGNSEMINKNYLAAKQLFQSALELKPNDQALVAKITEINNLIDEQERAESKQKTIDNAYNNAISQADAQFNQANYELAKELYAKAASVKPGERYPTDRIAQVDKIIQDRERNKKLAKQADINKQYQAALAQADNLFRGQDYQGALEAYSKANTLKPNEIYPKQKISQINKTVEAAEAKKQREFEAGYQGALAAAENSMIKKNYQAARENYQKALQFKPNDISIKNKIQEIDNLIKQEQTRLADQQSKKREYDDIITKADGLFSLKDYNSAKDEYQRASRVLPAEQYPRQRVQEIERLVAMESARKQREQETRYQNAINAANNYFLQKSYEKAKQLYQEALTYKPEDNLAKNRIMEIDNLVRQEQAKLAATEARKKQYNDMIARADGYYNTKNYVTAKEEYRKAMQVLPNEQYPKQKIDEINRLLAEQQKLLDEQQAIDNSYKQSISKADELFTRRQYDLAKSEYNKALSIKPDEQHPKNRITQIDNLLANQQKARQTEENYKNAIAEADRLFSLKNYTEAKTSYTRALEFKPGEAYPRTQVSKIDNLLADAERARQEELARQQQYDSFIKQGDNYFSASNYQQAKESYQKALSIKPREQYPKVKISKIDEMLSLLAQQKKQSSTSTATSRQTGISSKKPVLAELSFKNDSERDKYLAELKKKYPNGVTSEIYREKFRVTSRFIIIRDNEVKEFREIHFLNWGGKEFSMNGKPITQQYFESQVKPRPGEYFKEFEF
jgi:tetratricopeptide (TPR) repeat protein